MRVLVAHPAQQHSYRLATALKKIDMLDKYATTVYYKRGSWTALVAGLLKGRFKTKAINRRCEALTDDEVIQFCESEGLFKLLILNTKYFRKLYKRIKYHTADRFAKKAAKYAIKNNIDAVVTYDDCSPLLFEILKEEAPNIKRILDVSAANILFMREIYERDFELAPDFADRLKQERAIVWDADITARAKREIEAAQKFLVPSEFVARSLEFSGVAKNRMYKCPYGVDTSMFDLKEYHSSGNDISRPIKFIYVGGVKELKGISYLLHTFEKIPPNRATLTVVGKYDPKDEDIQPYKDRVEFIGSVLHSEMPDLLKQYDVFVFPSLGDSYALSVMEAAACGLPVIVSENTGTKDLVSDGVNGFIIPVQSVNDVCKKVEFFINHPDQIEIMGRKARQMAERNTWAVYYKQIGVLFRSF
jgi:glycosyltransferase involved in cell wall biosynthesis